MHDVKKRGIFDTIEDQGPAITSGLTATKLKQFHEDIQAFGIHVEQARKAFQDLGQALRKVDEHYPELHKAFSQRLTWRGKLKYQLRGLAGLMCLSTLLLTGCAGNQGGLLNSGIYKTTVGGPLARVGMTAAEVEHIMGPSWDTAGTQAVYAMAPGAKPCHPALCAPEERVLIRPGLEIWRYGVNLLGMVSPTCDYGRGGSVMCISVYFYNGTVADVISY